MEEQKLERAVYKALEDIVGPDYVTEDPVVLESYSFVWGNELFFGSRFAPFRPLAVIMPGSVEEIQAIVKTCNRFKVKFRAHSTGFETTALTSKTPMLIIDLRRLDRIILIDEKNMTAVVEPYVSHAELFYECIKRGLRFNALGAGPSASVVASSACHDGSGFHGISTHLDAQNLLAVEWVLPTGEVIRTGSMSTGSGWFAAHGPGLNLRSIVRGRIGPNGGLGIITKVAVKLAPWYGPPILNVKGKPPLYECEIPENMRLYLIAFPSFINLIDFLRLLEEEQIAFAACKMPLGGTTYLHVTTESNDHAWEKYKVKKDIIEKASYLAVVILDSYTPMELKIKEKCLAKLMEITRGETLQLNKKEESALFSMFLIGLGTFREAMRPAGTMMVAAWYDSSYDSCLKLVETTEKTIIKHVQEGKIVYMPGGFWLGPMGGQWVHLEEVYSWDPANPESVKATQEISEYILRTMIEQKFGLWGDGFIGFDDNVHESAGPACLNYHQKIRAIKRAIDPNNVSESSFYTTPK